jgi:ATP-dependent Lhr-like helicase
VLEFVASGGYALGSYDRFKRIVTGKDGLWRARNRDVAQRHRMNVGVIIESPMLDVRLVRGGKSKTMFPPPPAEPGTRCESRLRPRRFIARPCSRRQV